MAFFFTLLFVVTAYVTPEVLFGPLAQYRVELILAVLAVGTSVPNLVRGHLLETPDTYAFLAFSLAIPLSIMSGGWFGGATGAMYGFMPVVLCFFLPAVNFKTRQHLQWVTLAMLLASCYFMYCGLQDLHNNVIPSRFLYGDGTLRRLRGLGFVFDPNDLSQVLVSLIPMVFLWKSKNWLLNIFLVGIPVGILVTGMYFTHSRGAALALMATIIIAFRRKVGTVPAAVLGGMLFALSLAVGWSGGRDVSMEAGADRLDAWSTGIEFIKQHPFFGVGAGRFADFNEITAHNSIVVCAAEVGLPGFVCWVFMIFASIRGALGIDAPAPLDPEEDASPVPPGAAARLPHLRSRAPAALSTAGSAMGTAMAMAGPSIGIPLSLASPAASVPFRRTRMGADAPAPASAEQQEEIRRMARLLVFSLTGFLVAGWFLSRALSMWLFFYCGTMHAVVQMAVTAGMRPRRDSFAFLLRWSGAIAATLLLLVYGVLKVRSVTGR